MALSKTIGQFSNIVQLKLTNQAISKGKQPTLNHPITGKAIMPSNRTQPLYAGTIALAKNRVRNLRRLKRKQKAA